MQSLRGIGSTTPMPEPVAPKKKREREERIEAAVQKPLKESKVMEPKKHYLPMKGTIYLDNIKRGIKTHEGRVYRGTCKAMRVGDRLILQDKQAHRGIECEITSCTRYDSFREMLVANGVLNMLPQLSDFSKKHNEEELLAEGVKVYEKFPGSHDVKTLGCVAIGVNFIRDCK